MTWKPPPKQEQRMRQELVETNALAGLTRLAAVKVIMRKMGVKRAQAYNILKFLESKNWISISQPRIARMASP